MTVRILLIVPRKDYINPNWRDFLLSYQQERDKMNIERTDFKLEEKIIPIRELDLHHYAGDVIISRGFLSKTLQELKLSIPVVDIPVQGIDLVRSLFFCRQKYGKRKVAVIGASNMIYGTGSLQEIVDLEIKQYYLHHLSEIPQLVDTAKKEGCEVVLAGLHTCAYADSAGLQSIIIKTSEESFHQALREAERLAVASRKEQQRISRFQTILDNAYEGVIAIDLEQKVTAFNQAAQRILLMEEKDLIGKKIDDIIHGKLLDLLMHQKDYEEDIITYRSIILSVKKVSIYLRDFKFGHMVAFQDVTGIEEMENNIRKRIYLKGHVAKHQFDHIISESKLVKQTIDMAKKYSEVDSNILIIGETGTGKEMYTQSIHNFSRREKQPFVAINCAALPESLLESELFGYVEGAFTGAVKGGKKGIFELAHRGTLFLDEIGELSVHLQSRLLRVLQEREVMRIGDDKVIPVDVRIIAATNKNLLKMVKNNKFREDLYYRLSVLNLHLPPLRACKEDIPLLVQSFLPRYTADGVVIQITDEALERLSEQNWEGNVRELQNFCERLAVLCRDNQIGVEDIDAYLSTQIYTSEMGLPEEADKTWHHQSEQERIIEILKSNHYHKEETAKQLGISRTTLWRKLKAYQIDVT